MSLDDHLKSAHRILYDTKTTKCFSIANGQRRGISSYNTIEKKIVFSGIETQTSITSYQATSGPLINRFPSYFNLDCEFFKLVQDPLYALVLSNIFGGQSANALISSSSVLSAFIPGLLIYPKNYEYVRSVLYEEIFIKRVSAHALLE